MKATARETDEYDHGTEQGRAWAGFGTELKPAHEPIIMARKPPVGTIAQNVLTHRTGALNIDGCRVGGPDGFGGGRKASSGFADGYEHDGFVASTKGRWPANAMFAHGEACRSTRCAPGCPVRELEGQSPGASRFFFVAKAGRDERPTLNIKKLRLRADLTVDERAYVLSELMREGVDVA